MDNGYCPQRKEILSFLLYSFVSSLLLFPFGNELTKILESGYIPAARILPAVFRRKQICISAGRLHWLVTEVFHHHWKSWMDERSLILLNV